MFTLVQGKFQEATPLLAMPVRAIFAVNRRRAEGFSLVTTVAEQLQTSHESLQHKSNLNKCND